jgi:RNA polymerase sigma-70 factor (ECF subfamily)
MLRAYLHKKFPTLTDVDDVVQESYLRIMRAKIAGTLRSTRGFLFTTARNAAFDVFRRRRTVSLEDIVEIDRLPVLEDSRPGVAETISRDEEFDLLAEAIESLPRRCRQVLKLRKIYGLSHKEIAERLDISKHTVNVQVGKGVRRCAEYLQTRGVTILDTHERGKFQSSHADEP